MAREKRKNKSATAEFSYPVADGFVQGKGRESSLFLPTERDSVRNLQSVWHFFVIQQAVPIYCNPRLLKNRLCLLQNSLWLLFYGEDGGKVTFERDFAEGFAL